MQAINIIVQPHRKLKTQHGLPLVYILSYSLLKSAYWIEFNKQHIYIAWSLALTSHHSLRLPYNPGGYHHHPANAARPWQVQHGLGLAQGCWSVVLPLWYAVAAPSLSVCVVVWVFAGAGRRAVWGNWCLAGHWQGSGWRPGCAAIDLEEVCTPGRKISVYYIVLICIFLDTTLSRLPQRVCWLFVWALTNMQSNQIQAY